MNNSTTKPMPALTSVAILAFIGTLIETSMNVTFPTLSQTFHVNLGTVQWITSGYLMIMALTMMCSAFLQRRYSLINLFDYATAAFVIGALLSLCAQKSFFLLLIGRLIQAGCAGIAIPSMINLTLTIIPIQQVGFYMSTAGMIVNLAPALGPTFGGLMVSIASWKFIFLVTLPIVILTWLLGRKTLLPFSHKGRKLKFPSHQFTLLAIAFLVFNWSFSQFNGGWIIFLILIGLIIVSCLLLWFYNKTRNHTETDLLNLSLFKQKNVRRAFFIYASIQLVNLGVNLVIPNLVQMAQHLSAFKSGLILLPGSLLVALINPLFGKLYDRYGGAKPIGGGLFLMLLGMIGLLIVNQLGIFGELIIVYIIFSIGRTMAFSNVLTDTLKHTATTAQADINALFSTGQQLAGSVGSTLGAVLMTIPVNLLANNFQPVLGQAVFLTLLIIILIAIIVNHLLFHPFKNTSE